MTRAYLVVVMLLLSNVASAQQPDDERARMHFQSGFSHYEQARYDEAAREFVEAYSLSQRPALLLGLSQAYERDLKFAEAIAELQRYLEAVPDSPERRTVEARIARMGELQARVGTASTTTAPTAQAEPSVAAPTTPQTEPETTTPAGQSHESGSSVSLPGVIFASAGGLMIAGSIVIGVMAQSAHTDLEGRCPGGVCPAEGNAQSDIDSGRTLAWLSTGLLAGGVISGAIGAVLILMGGSDDSEPVAATVTLTPGKVMGLARVTF